MILTNYHAHTNFCDGKESPEAMVREAIACGFQIFGFSAHSIHPFGEHPHRADYVYCREKTEVIIHKGKENGT